MKVTKTKEFECWYDQDSGALFQDMEFQKCRFVSSAVSITRKPELRSTVRNMRFIDCAVRGCAVNAAIVEDVLVDGLKTHTMLDTWAAVFKHVTIRGRVGSIKISKYVDVLSATDEEQAAFDRANAEYYKHVDWALDISEAECLEIDIRGVPASLVRRDPTTQGVVKRANTVDGRWQKVKLARPRWQITIQDMFRDGDDDTVLVVPKRSRHYQELLGDLKRLRDAGIAEPD